MSKLRIRLAILVGVVWALSFTDAVVTGMTTLFGFVTPVMLVVVTALFTLDKWRNGNGNGNGNAGGK